MKKKLFVGSLILVLMLQMTIFSVPSFYMADENYNISTSAVEGTETAYDLYVKNNGGIKYANNNTINLSNQDTVLSFDQTGLININVSIPNNTWYAINFDYCIKGESGSNIIKLMLDGKAPFKDMEQINLKQYWLPSEITTDDTGNDSRMPSIADKNWHTYSIEDEDGAYLYPYEFYFTAGTHTISFQLIDGSVDLQNIKLYSYQKPISYKEYKEKYSKVYSGKEPKVIEAEKYVYSNSISINASTDMSSPITTPYSSRKLKLNVLGGENWKYTGDKVEWSVNAPEEGMYAVTFRYKQNYREGLTSYRKIYVNGEVPYDLANSYGFTYDNVWQNSEAIYLYLNKGENKIALECTVGENSEIAVGVNDIIARLNKLYRQIIMITGPSPDVYRDYSLETEIGGLDEQINSISKDTDDIIKKVIERVGEGGHISVLKDISRQLSDMKANISTITKSGRLSKLKSNISSLASFSMQLNENPLLLDSITLYSPKHPFEPGKETFGLKFKHEVLRFIATFVEDYSSGIGDKNSELTVWTATGRDQMQILSQLANNELTDMSVRLQLVTGSVIQAILAGRAPDVVMGRAETEIINFAMRNAVSDLSVYDDFEEVKNRFSKTALTPFTYENKVYALPETQSFDMMFVRTDVLEEFGLEIPKTWDDLTENILLVLKRNNLMVGLGNLSTGGVLGGILTTSILQNGGSLYTDDLLSSNIASPEALEAFDFVVSLYREYGVPQQYDFMNRFRTGEMPIAIGPYVNYNLLKVTAPEIDGLWTMVPIPGVKNEDGTINNSQFMTNTGVILLDDSKNKEDGWKFIKWWTSENVQKQFGLQQEAKLGASGRYATANINAMKGLFWNTEQLKLLESQRDASRCFNHIPGSYFVGRALNNATVLSVTDTETIPREELIRWNELIENELVRKRKEFNYKGISGGN